MPTLYLRNVPDEVVSDLERRARKEGSSVTVVAVRELSAAARRSKNAELLESLPDLGIPAQAILDDLDAGRAER